MTKRFFFFIALIVASSLAVLPLSAVALSAGGLSIYPATEDPANSLTKSWFIYNFPPGATHSDALIIFNNFDEPLTVDVYAVDATTNNVGGFALAERNAPRTGIGAWISLTIEDLIVPPHQETQVPFTMTLPAKLEPGEYSGGIIVELVENGTSDNQQSIATKTRIGVRVYETVPGVIIEKVSLQDFTASLYQPEGSHTFSAVLANEGNVSMPVDLTLVIKNVIFDNVKTVVGVAAPAFLSSDPEVIETNVLIPPASSLTVPLQIQVPKFGKYEVFLEGSYKDTTFSSETVSFWAIPWFEIILVMGAAAFFVFSFFWDAMRRQKRARVKKK